MLKVVTALQIKQDRMVIICNRKKKAIPKSWAQSVETKRDRNL